MSFTRGALLPGAGTIGDWFILTTTNVLYCCLVTNQWTANGSDLYISGIAQVLGNCDNTSDAAKPISTATQTALNAKGTSNFSGVYTDLTSKPTLGTAAATAATDYATSAQGTKADSAVQPAGNVATATKLATARAINGVNFDGTAPITVTAAGSTLSDTVTVAKGGTGLATLTAFALQVGNGASAPAQLSAVAIGQVLASKGTGANPAYVTYAATMATPANQTGNATATFKMNGLGAAAAPATITPTATGRVVFHITGSIGNGTTADSVTWKLAYGTGAAPANAAAATGTVIGATGVFKALTGQLDAPFIAMGLATGLALNTAVWYDLQIADITGGTVTATAVTCMAWEV